MMSQDVYHPVKGGGMIRKTPSTITQKQVDEKETVEELKRPVEAVVEEPYYIPPPKPKNPRSVGRQGGSKFPQGYSKRMSASDVKMLDDLISKNLNEFRDKFVVKNLSPKKIVDEEIEEEEEKEEKEERKNFNEMDKMMKRLNEMKDVNKYLVNHFIEKKKKKQKNKEKKIEEQYEELNSRKRKKIAPTRPPPLLRQNKDGSWSY